MGIAERWLLFGSLMTLAIIVMVVKKLTVCSWVRRKNPAAAISIVGGWLGGVACGLSPSPLLNKLWWAPGVFDAVGGPYLFIIAWTAMREVMNAEDTASIAESDKN